MKTLCPFVFRCPRAFYSTNNKFAFVKEQLEGIRAAGTYKDERVIIGKQGPSIHVQSTAGVLLNFCANNYLGLSSDPQVIESARSALSTHGSGYSSVRFICGTSDKHKELEEKISAFHGREDTILYPSCFDANTGLFEALLGPDDAILSDELNHASIIDGVRLCKASRYRYSHGNIDDLHQKLQEAQACRVRLVATDGVFSMDGNIAKLPEIVNAAQRFNALTFVDECHSTGLFGSTGRGTEEHFELPTGSVDIINSTLGKALGGAAGGYTTGPKEVIDLLRQKSRPYLFSNTLPPPVVAGAIKVFDMLTHSNHLPQRLKENTQLFRKGMADAGFKLAGDPASPICPVMLGDARLAADFAKKMLQEGVFVVGFSFPVVPKGKARIRVQISAAHKPSDIDKAVGAFVKVGRDLKVLSSP